MDLLMKHWTIDRILNNMSQCLLMIRAINLSHENALPTHICLHIYHVDSPITASLQYYSPDAAGNIIQYPLGCMGVDK